MPYRSIDKKRESKRNHYLRNISTFRERTRKLRKQKREYIEKVKSGPCLDCGLYFPTYVMDFDHREGNLKINNITAIVTSSSWKALKEEIKKCDVVCSNCHRVRTFKRKQHLSYKVNL